MEVLKYKNIGSSAWDEYIKKLPGAVFNFSSLSIEFIMEYSKDTIANESFLLMANGKICGAAVLCIEKEESHHQNRISWSQRYCPAPYIDRNIPYKTAEKLIRETMEIIAEIETLYQIKEVKFQIDPLLNPEFDIKVYNYNYLMKYGFLDDTSMTQMIDLRRSEEELWTDIKSSFKRYIRKGSIYSIDWYTSENISEDTMQIARSIYEEDAGRVTRNSELTMHYYSFIKNGLGVLGIAKKDGEPVAVIIATCYNDTAYYSVYAEREQLLGKVPVGHVLQWELMKVLKRRGISFYEIGEQDYGKTHYHNPDKKLKEISHFKRSFGGYTVSHWKGIKVNPD